MAVTIITRGIAPRDIYMRSTCSRCGTVFEYQALDAKKVEDSRDGDYYSIKCPLDWCNNIVGATAADRISSPTPLPNVSKYRD